MIGKERRQPIDDDPDLRLLPLVVMRNDPHFIGQFIDERPGVDEVAVLVADETGEHAAAGAPHAAPQ